MKEKFSNIFINSSSATFNIIFLLIIFEVIFYIFVISVGLNDVTSNIVKLSKDAIDINIKNIFYEVCSSTKITDKTCEELIDNDLFNNFINDIQHSKEQIYNNVMERTNNINKKQKRNNYIILGSIIFIYLIFIIIFQIIYKKKINFKKMGILLSISYIIIIVLEVILFFLVYSKLRPFNNTLIIIDILKYIGKNL
jgi:hypothetical protein